jgi:hypothetical protein
MSDTFHPACVIYPAPENAVPLGQMPSADNRACVEAGDGTWLSYRALELLYSRDYLLLITFRVHTSTVANHLLS